MASYVEPPEGSLVEILAGRARHTPEALAYKVEGEAITYGALADQARQVAGVLAAAGLSPGAHCGIVLPTTLDFLRTLFAVQWMGAIPVALNPSLPPGLTAARARRIGCALVVAEHTLARALEGEGLLVLGPGGAPAGSTPELGEPQPNPVAFLQITSGTSGEPRTAKIGQSALIAAARAAAAVSGLSEDDVFAGWVPLHHAMGLVRFVFLPLFMGRPAHLINPSLGRLRDWLAMVASERATITAAPDSVYRITARSVAPDGLDLTCLRVAISAGEPVRISTVRAFESRFDLAGVVRPSYGLAEATFGITTLRSGEPLRLDAAGHVGCGRPWPGTEVRIVDEKGTRLPPLTVGEIVVRSPSLFEGYLADEEATHAILRDGWLWTGDLGVLAEDGQLFVRGRRRAMIKRAGAVIAPREIEEAVDRLEGVRLSAAIGASFDGTEDVCVVVETRRPFEGEERAVFERAIAAEVARTIGFAPARVLLTPLCSIPQTANGKLRHAELARKLAAGDLEVESG